MYGDLKRKQILASFGEQVKNAPKDKVLALNKPRYDEIMKAFEGAELFDESGEKIIDREIALKKALKFSVTLEKASGGKLNTGHLVLKEVTFANGKTGHRWVDPNSGNEPAAPKDKKQPEPATGAPKTPTATPAPSEEKKKPELNSAQQAEREKADFIKETMSKLAEGAGQAAAEKMKEYADRIKAGEDKDKVMEGLPKSFMMGVQKLLNAGFQNHAANTSTENLEKFVNNKEGDVILTKIAQEELKRRKDAEKPEGKEAEEKRKEKPKEPKTKEKPEKKAGSKDKMTPEKASKETGVPEEDVEEGEDGEGDINRRFKTFERFTKAFAKGKTKSLIAYGSGGVGKTHTVTSELKKQGLKEFKQGMEPGSADYDFVKITGKSTPTAVYQALWEHNGKKIIFDDCDSVLKHEDAINMFKGALDTSGDGTISYGSAKTMKDVYGNDIPKRFDFNGSVAFISNLDPDEVPQPLKSRALRIDMTMTPQQTIDRIRHIATSSSGDLTNLEFPGPGGKPLKYDHETMEDAIKFLDKYKNKTSDLNVRTIGSILAIIQEAKEDGDDDWEADAKAMILSKGLEATYDDALGVLL